MKTFIDIDINILEHDEDEIQSHSISDERDS